MSSTSPSWLHGDWIAAILRDEVQLDLAGCPGIMRTGPDWDMNWQVLEQWLCYAFVSGNPSLHWHWDGQPCQQRLGPDSFICMPAGLRFRLQAGLQDSQFLRVRFRLSERVAEPLPLIIDGMAEQFSLLGLLVDEAEHRESTLHPLRASGLLAALFGAGLRQQQQPRARLQLSPQQRERLEHHFSRHVHERPEPRELAELVGLSEDYFTRLFRASYGLPPRQWMLRQRLAHIAIALTESRRSISTIADDFGYGSLTLMGRQFRKQYGRSPRSFRQEAGAR